MANHLTRRSCPRSSASTASEVIQLCIEESVPIYQGKIDKTLFQAQLEAVAQRPTPGVAGA